MTENDKLERARSRFIDSMAQNMNLYGITPSVGRLYGLLYFNGEPMTLDSMKDELGMSKTSMSTSVRQLQELNMVEKIWKKGSRKDLYQSLDNWYETFSNLFSVKWRTAVTANVNAIQKSLVEIEELIDDPNVSVDIKTVALEDKNKFEYALEYYEWLNRLVDSIESNEIFDFIPKHRD